MECSIRVNEALMCASKSIPICIIQVCFVPLWEFRFQLNYHVYMYFKSPVSDGLTQWIVFFLASYKRAVSSRSQWRSQHQQLHSFITLVLSGWFDAVSSLHINFKKNYTGVFSSVRRFSSKMSSQAQQSCDTFQTERCRCWFAHTDVHKKTTSAQWV